MRLAKGRFAARSAVVDEDVVPVIGLGVPRVRPAARRRRGGLTTAPSLVGEYMEPSRAASTDGSYFSVKCISTVTNTRSGLPFLVPGLNTHCLRAATAC